mgnify:CR=1 FL=1
MDDGVVPVRVQSAAFPERDRIEAMREAVCRPILSVDVEPLCGTLEFDLTLYDIPDLGIGVGDMSPARCTRTSAITQNDDVILTCVMRGGVTVRERGREAVVGVGEAVFASNDVPGAAIGYVPSRSCNLRFTRARLQSMSLDIDAALVRTMARDSAALRLLRGYVEIMNDTNALATPELRRIVAAHFYDLVALLMGASADAAHMAQGNGVRAARLRAIQGDIRDNLTQGGLSVNDVALRHDVSPRYVQMLFEAQGSTFSGFVLEQRLALARRMLANPGLRARKISEVAWDAGFQDLSYFNRMFRRRYGMTPSEARLENLRPV